MAKKKTKAKESVTGPMAKSRGKAKCNNMGNGGSIYGIGLVGALVYYISTATSFWMGVLGFLKSLVWPGFLVYEALKFLGA